VHVSDVQAIVERYIASWAEPDAEARRETIAALWATDAVYKNAVAEYRGLEGIETAVKEAYDTFTTKGYTFRVVRVDSNHEAARYTWAMTPAGGSEPEVVCTQMLTFDEQGLLQRDFQFVDKAPAATLEALDLPPID
jgi:hypothetical protein